jgi:hypothetical protein
MHKHCAEADDLERRYGAIAATAIRDEIRKADSGSVIYFVRRTEHVVTDLNSKAVPAIFERAA